MQRSTLKAPWALLLLLLAATVGCASSGGGGGGTGGQDLNTLTEAELTASGASNAYDAVQRIRPRWLQSRGGRSVVGQTIIAVVVNGSFFGDPDTLRQFPIDDVVGIQYLTGPAAANEVRGAGPGTIVEAAIILQLRGR